MNKILLLEDDPMLAKTLIKFLQKNGYDIDWAKDGEEASTLSYDSNYLIYLFDINVPYYNGDDLLKDLRDSNDSTPCILISALVDIESITKGFRSGADDYIKKPFDPQELLIRIQVKTDILKKSVKYKNFELFIDEEKILCNGKEIYISYILKNIFISLLKNYPNPVTKDDLMQYLETSNETALRVNISKLKQKLNIDIKNIRNLGYKLD